jgi:hypothetical protein
VSDRDINDAIQSYVVAQVSSGNAFFDFSKLLNKETQDKINSFKSKLSDYKDQAVTNLNTLK